MLAKKIILTLYLMIIYSAISYGQKRNMLSGIVRDALDQSSISNAYVYTNSGENTITDSLGGFNLTYLNPDLAYIVISHLSYENDTVFFSQVEPNQSIEVNLDILVTYLDEVVVQNINDPALLLMSKVIENLPKNFKRKGCSSHYALLRESLQLKGNDSIRLYLIETTVKDYVYFEDNKLKYKVDLLNTRTYINPDYYSFSEIGLTGTAFINEKYNPVLTLSGPLDSSNYVKKYKFSIIDTSYVSNEEFIRLEFKRSKDTVPQGYLIVNSNDFSISEFQISRYRESSFLPSIDSYMKKAIDLFVSYKWDKDNYAINELSVVQKYFPFKGDTLLSKGHYIKLKTSSCKFENQSKYPLNKNDVLLDKLVSKEAPTWKPSTIKETKRFDYLFENKSSIVKQEGEVKQKRSFKSRLRLGYRVPLWISNINHFNIHFQHSIASFNGSINARRSISTSIATFISFELTSSLLVQLGGFDSFKRDIFSNRYLEILHESKLNSSATTFLNVGIQFGYFKQRIFFQSMTGAEFFFVNGKKFDSGEFEIYFEQRSFTISPILSYSHKIGHSSYFEFGCHYPINTILKNGVFLNEKDSFFRRKRAFTDENVMVISDGKTVINNTPNVFFGIKWLLK